MRHQADTEEDSPPRVGANTPWKVTEVRLLSGYRLFVRFADGTGGEVDLSKLIGGPTPGVFECLRDPARFAEVKIDGGAGRGLVTWILPRMRCTTRSIPRGAGLRISAGS